jgi:hypothetical protein
LHLLHVTAAIGMFIMLLASQDRIIRTLAVPVKAYFALRPIASVGKYSIQMFVFHVFLMAVFIEINRYLGAIESAVVGIAFLLIFIATPSLWQRLKLNDRVKRRDDPAAALAIVSTEGGSNG